MAAAGALLALLVPATARAQPPTHTAAPSAAAAACEWRVLNTASWYDQGYNLDMVIRVLGQYRRSVNGWQYCGLASTHVCATTRHTSFDLVAWNTWYQNGDPVGTRQGFLALLRGAEKCVYSGSYRASGTASVVGRYTTSNGDPSDPGGDPIAERGIYARL